MRWFAGARFWAGFVELGPGTTFPCSGPIPGRNYGRLLVSNVDTAPHQTNRLGATDAASVQVRETAVFGALGPGFGRRAGGCSMAETTVVKPIRAIAWPGGETSDWALVQHCTAGDELACAQLVADHQRMVYTLALHLLGDSQEAMDLSQEVFLRVFRTISTFRGQSALRTWIYRIVINQARNRQRWWRRRHRADQVSLDDHVAQFGDMESTGEALPDRLLASKETAACIW